MAKLTQPYKHDCPGIIEETHEILVTHLTPFLKNISKEGTKKKREDFAIVNRIFYYTLKRKKNANNYHYSTNNMDSNIIGNISSIVD